MEMHHSFMFQLVEFYRGSIEDKIPASLTGSSQFSGESMTDVMLGISLLFPYLEGLTESARRLLSTIPDMKRSIVQDVSKQCNQNLEPTHTVPRLYRRTNKEVCFIM